MFAPDVIGYNYAKMGILLSAASTGTDLKQKKVNVAFVRDLGLAKSTLLIRAVNLVKQQL